jgi:hypothetical protein
LCFSTLPAEKSAVTEHNIKLYHRIQFHDTSSPAKEYGRMNVLIKSSRVRCKMSHLTLMMMTEMDIETSVYYVHLTRLIAREDFIKFTRRESTKTYIVWNVVSGKRQMHFNIILPSTSRFQKRSLRLNIYGYNINRCEVLVGF